ncbi:hypothetical protein DYB28_013177 [Aphanomyces astaci]|uniref:DDE-1 domain-containing protein n=1 Tax=Aphanomyces astaci TaxID=112090 RepID=A0A9X8H5V4_APHAT|nr:hypothetical protein DYB28_013177 [Aphanomyces astaci]
MTVRDEFAEDFHHSYRAFDDEAIYNVDETGFYYDMPPRYIWVVRGGDAKISSVEKHSLRMTVVLTVRGRIDSHELQSYPPGHFKAVQLKAWMGNEVWTTYLRSLLLPQLSEPSILLLGNFESHVSEESYSIVTD